MGMLKYILNFVCMNKSVFYKRHFAGDGGISKLLAIAFPMIVSQASDTCMMFADRYFLSQLGKVYISASMIGGISSFFVMTLWFGMNGYVNALVAQHYGAKEYGKCSLAVMQGLILCILSYPFILCSIPLTEMLFHISLPDPEQLILQKKYFVILTLGTPLALIRVVLSGFFSGIGRTAIVMFANITGMLINIPLTYAMVFGKFGLPRLEISGAAYGTVIASCTTSMILLISYMRKKYRARFEIMKNVYLDKKMFCKLVRYGFPIGAELFLAIAAFNVAMQQFHTYGIDVATAMTITFNWDLVAFLPMIGLSTATTSLVGQNIGAGNLYEAERSGISGLKISSTYSLSIAAIFLLFPNFLINVFIPENKLLNYTQVISMAKEMLYLVTIYISFDAWSLVLSGTLRGAGDTLWPMWISIIYHWLFTSAIIFLIRWIFVPPMLAWSIFIMLPIFQCATVFLRFKIGNWKSVQCIRS